MEQTERSAQVWPLQTLGAVMVIAFDWATMALNVFFWFEGYPPATVVMSLLAGLTVAIIEYRHARSLPVLASIKGIIVAVLVSLPFPIFGTLLALGSMICALLLRRTTVFSRRPPGDRTRHPNLA
jgi:hypothetical protein